MSEATIDEPLCCGQLGSWRQAGTPIVTACTLCPNSGTYWRNSPGVAERERAEAARVAAQGS